MKSPTEVIGFDPGQLPAFAALDPATGKFLRGQDFVLAPAFDAKLDWCFRAHHIACAVLEEVATVPGTKIVGIESLARSRMSKGSTAHESLARCRQALYDACAFWLEDFEFVEVPIEAAKRAVTGNAHAAKEQVATMVEKVYHVSLPRSGKATSRTTVRRYAMADAIAIAAATRSIHHQRRPGR